MTNRAHALVQSALQGPLAALPSTIQQGLAELRPDCCILNGSEHQFELDSFAHAGLCTLSDRPGALQLHETYFSHHHGLFTGVELAWRDVRWKGVAMESVVVTWPGKHCDTKHQWLIARERASAEAFWEEVARWSGEIRAEVLVFNQGSWQKDQELFQAIQGTRLQNLVLPGNLVEEIVDDLVRFLANREAYERYQVPWKRGILLTGPPGNGKTHCIKGLINRLRIPCLYVRSFRSMHASDQTNMQRVFERARTTTPCLLVMEDLDALITDKNRSYLLNELDGFAANAGILTLATTNHPERLDPAIRDRPRRFDRTWNFPLPELAERSRYIAAWNTQLVPAVAIQQGEVGQIAAATEGFSYAYLKELFVSSLMRWIAAGEPQCSMLEVLRLQAQQLQSQMATGMQLGMTPPAGRRTMRMTHMGMVETDDDEHDS